MQPDLSLLQTGNYVDGIDILFFVRILVPASIVRWPALLWVDMLVCSWLHSLLSLSRPIACTDTTNRLIAQREAWPFRAVTDAMKVI